MSARRWLSNVVLLLFRTSRPLCTGSAEFFAFGAVSLLDALGCVDFLCFGSECGEIEKLLSLAQFLLEEPASFKEALQASLKSGLSYPAARKKAALQTLNDQALCNILNEPNNILGIEYLKALKRRKSPIRPLTIQRQGAHYHDAVPHETFSSASAIRKLFLSQGEDALSTLVGHVPETVHLLCKEAYNIRFPVCSNDFSLLLKYRLLQETADSLRALAGYLFTACKPDHPMQRSVPKLGTILRAVKNKGAYLHAHQPCSSPCLSGNSGP